MSVVPFVPIVDAVDLPRDTAMRLRALLVARLDDEVARLQRLAATQDPTFIDEHAEISATVGNETMREINDALSRFDAGTYGWCRVCGEAIPVERLEAIPHAATCVVCARRR